MCSAMLLLGKRLKKCGSIDVTSAATAIFSSCATTGAMESPDGKRRGGRQARKDGERTHGRPRRVVGIGVRHLGAHRRSESSLSDCGASKTLCLVDAAARSAAGGRRRGRAARRRTRRPRPRRFARVRAHRRRPAPCPTALFAAPRAARPAHIDIPRAGVRSDTTSACRR